MAGLNKPDIDVHKTLAELKEKSMKEVCITYSQTRRGHTRDNGTKIGPENLRALKVYSIIMNEGEIIRGKRQGKIWVKVVMMEYKDNDLTSVFTSSFLFGL